MQVSNYVCIIYAVEKIEEVQLMSPGWSTAKGFICFLSIYLSKSIKSKKH